MSENTGKTPEESFSVQEPAPSPNEEVESAKILFQEDLIEEAKKVLHRVLINHPEHRRARALLEQIHQSEYDGILKQTGSARSRKTKLENPEAVIAALEEELGLRNQNSDAPDPGTAAWVHGTRNSPQERFDLGVAFFEMGCFKDALIELEEGLRLIRLQQSELGPLGVSVAALLAEALIELGEAFSAKSFLIPLLAEPELSEDSKLPLFYLMGRTEDSLGRKAEARAWYRRVLDADPWFRDADFRARID